MAVKARMCSVRLVSVWFCNARQSRNAREGFGQSEFVLVRSGMAVGSSQVYACLEVQRTGSSKRVGGGYLT